MKILILILFCLIFQNSSADSLKSNLDTNFNAKVSVWKVIPHGQARWIQLPNLSLSNHKKINFGLHIKLEKDWHTYWQNPGDSGAPPEIYAQNLEERSKTIEIFYPYPKRINAGPLITYGYEDELIYFFKADHNKIDLIADLLVCKEICIPGSISLKTTETLLNSKEQSLKQIISDQLKKLPELKRGKYVKGLSQVSWSFELPKQSQIIDFFWFPEVLNNLNRPSFSQNLQTFKFYTTQKDLGPNTKKQGLIVYKSDLIIKSQVIKFKEESAAISLFFLMALVGGLILNLMPCVFPIVSLKAFSILKTSGLKLTKIRLDNLAYSFGVIVCFIGMGLLLSFLRSTGSYLGWGFQLQNPYVVAVLAFTFFIISLSFFEIWSWNWVPVFARHYYPKDSLWSSFLTGLLAVIVASPCTAPFMGAAIGFALTQSNYSIFIVFLGLGLGMSFPFLIMSLFPSLSKYLPRPGVWMIYFKKIMGMMLLLTVVWLLWILIQLVQPKSSVSEENWSHLDVNNWSKLTDNTDYKRFVNFTADWCVTCKINEKLVFSQDSVRKYVTKNNVKMYKVDWTQREDKIGTKLSEFGRAGVPLYLYFPKGSRVPIILSELLTPAGLLSELEDK